MNGFVQASTVLLPSAYLMAAMVHGMAFAGSREPSFAPRMRPLLLWGVVLLHGLMFAARWQVAGAFPITGAWLLLSATAWVVAILFALITWRVHTPATGAIVLAMVCLLQGLASCLGPVRAEALPAADASKLLHVVTVVLASAAVVLSGVFAYLHLTLYRQMRRKVFGPLYRELPDLELLARLTRRAALVGFVMLTAGLNVGIGMAHARGTEGFNYRDPHVLLTIGVWLHFGMIAFSRRMPGLTARRTSIAAVIGLLLLLLTIALTLIPAATFHGLG